MGIKTNGFELETSGAPRVEQSAPASPSGAARSARPTSQADLDRAVGVVKDRSNSFADTSCADKVNILNELVSSLRKVADEWVNVACAAKGIDPASNVAAEERLAGPVVTIRNARLLARSFESKAKYGRPVARQPVREYANGRKSMNVFPTSGHDSALFSGFKCEVLFQDGADWLDLHSTGEDDGPVRGGCALILGAGNVSSIPPMDAFYKMFVEGATGVLKMNPVNEWAGPILEKALYPLIARGYLRIVYGGAEEGSYLCSHPGVDNVHITGSDKTHDLIVWGPPGPERERRKAAKDPLLKKSITSELGNVSPVMIVPGPYTDDQLWFQARNVATMVGNNGSFNCNAAKLLVTSRHWKQREKFLALVAKALSDVTPRDAYYPGSTRRWGDLSERHPEGERLAQERAGQGRLPWLFIRNVDPTNPDEPLFREEPFCAVLSETALDAEGPIDFLRKATAFCNDRVWGTLNATIIIHPKTEKHEVAAHALDQAILDLRYGTVAINHWPAVSYGLVSPPWGGHPSATLENVQSGIGWVHNTYMLNCIEKSILRGPLVVKPTPPWFCGNPAADKVAVKLVDFETAPSWLKFPGVALMALKGK
jgi:aldehyde dehydrogenase (NAD(P)+)